MKVKTLLLALSLGIVFAIVGGQQAFAWQFNLSNVDGTLVQGQTYTMNVEFEGATSDYLDFLSFAIEWDTNLLALTAFVDVAEYDRSPGFPDPDYSLWGPTDFTPTPDTTNGRYYDVNAQSALLHMGEFFPEATGESLMATFTFEAQQSGTFTDMASFYFTPETNLTEAVVINDTEFGAEAGTLQISKIGSSSVISAVPIPGAVWLLGTGLLGMIGLRRRNR